MNGALYSEHLSRVSRSFALCIEQMQSPEKEYIGLSYILCRLADTVEDSKWSDLKQQEESFLNFMKFIESRPNSNEVALWRDSIPTSIPDGEATLIEDTEIFINDFHNLEEPIRSHIQRCVLDMSRGMLYFSVNHRHGGELQLNTLKETNQYCFFVAGIVGELLTMIISHRYHDLKVNDELMLNAHHFGLYLQKVNLLKDHLPDTEEGRHLVANFQQLRDSLVNHAIHALKYIEDIPLNAKEYRFFCSLSLFLGLASLEYIDQSFLEKKLTKIPRFEAMKIYAKIKLIGQSNEKLRAEFNRYINYQSPHFSRPEMRVSDKTWFQKIYTGHLQPWQMAVLGLV